MVIGGGFFNKADLLEDKFYRRFVRELNRYWLFEKDLKDFLKKEGEANIDQEEYEMIVKNAEATTKTAAKADEIAERLQREKEEEEAANNKGKKSKSDISEEASAAVAAHDSSAGKNSQVAGTADEDMNSADALKPGSANDKADIAEAEHFDEGGSSNFSETLEHSFTTGSEASSSSASTAELIIGDDKFTRSYIMNMKEEEQPLFFFNEFGDAGKRLLARMLIPDPDLRPQIEDIMKTSVIKRLQTCVPEDSCSVGLPVNAAEFKKFKEMQSKVLKHKHRMPNNGPSLLGLGFKDPYKDLYY
ncbi:hypothetical protein D0Z03_000800 [Geotrichum reessii]|nr:hypothetical protein D0Z03_000800 [Galactomyces reessii]